MMRYFRTPVTISIAMVMLISTLFLAFIPTAVQAETTVEQECYLVSGAGTSGANGLYIPAGSFRGKPAYKHETENFFLAYEAFLPNIFPNEWNLTTSLGGGLDYYFKISTSDTPPLGKWNIGGFGLSPAPKVSLAACPGALVTTIFDLDQWAPLDGNAGRYGVFTPSSCYDGTLTIEKYAPRNDPKEGLYNIKIHGRYLDLSIASEEGKHYEIFCGFYYFSFPLTGETFKLWNAGNLGIYEYDGTSWVEVPSFLVDGEEFGRVTFIATHPGRYALGTEK